MEYRVEGFRVKGLGLLDYVGCRLVIRGGVETPVLTRVIGGVRLQGSFRGRS